MFLIRRNNIIELLDTMLQMLKELFKTSNIEQNILECMRAINTIKCLLEKEEIILPDTTLQLTNISNLFLEFIEETIVVNEETIQNLIGHIDSLKIAFIKEIHIQLNILFLPYKAAMWDSLASIYEAAMKDKDCVAKVVPVPYFELEQNAEIPEYEGDLFPEDLPVIHYNSYNFEAELPDIIFVHNIYDQYNKVTRVHEFFFTKNLKKYTNMLVYVPYHISEPYKSNGEGIRAAYFLPGIKYVDKVVLPGKFIQEEALRDGIPCNKLVTMGSPKFDSMIKSLANEIEFPKEWRKQFEGKKVILLTTSCTFFCNGKFSNMDIFNQLLDIPRYLEDIVLLWRPHPLTIQCTKKYRPDVVENIKIIYQRFRTGKKDCPWWENFIIDESSDYFPALKAADMLITDGGSLMQSYLLTEKSIMLLGVKDGISEKFLLPADAFYYFYDKDLPWYKLLKKFVKGYDPLKDKRKNLALNVYENVDGSCGEKIYHEIKMCVLDKK